MAFRICVIGCGWIAESSHGPAYARYRQENPDTELAACCDLDREKAAEYAEKFGFTRAYYDYGDMLRIEKPDAVCVLVNETYTAEVASTVMSMGYPAFIEKPPGKDSAQTRALIRVANGGGVINQVGYNRRFMPILRALRRMITEGQTGERTGRKTAPQFIRYDIFRNARYDADFSDTAVHGIDAVRFISGADYKSVRFTYQALPEYGPGVKNIYMDSVMTNGIHTQLAFCPVTGVVLERALVLAEGEAWMAHAPIWAYGCDQPGEIIRTAGGSEVTTISGAGLCDSDEVYMTNGFYHEDKEFFDSVKTGRKCACYLESSLNTSLVKDCITNGAGRF